MKTIRFGSVDIELCTGDITAQPDMDAVVNAANAQLQTGGGVAGAIHRAAGPELAAEGRRLAPLQPGEAVMTDAYRLSNQKVIHCLGPVYGVDEPAAELLARCYQNALRLAEAAGLRSLAFPALSTGAFGYPMVEAARIALATVKDEAAQLQRVKTVRFVLFSDRDLKVHADALDAMKG